MQRARLVSLCFTFASFVGACDLADDDLYALHIASPSNDQSFVKREDTNPHAAGMQIAVHVETTERRMPVELLRLVGGAPEVVARTITVDGVASFPSVTLFPGANRLQARAAQSGRTSLPITVYFEDPCGSIQFLSPLPPDEELLVLGPQSGGSCAPRYTIPLLASTGLRDGTRVSVLLDKRRVATGVTRGGTLSIAEVPIEERGAPLELALLVEDQSCEPVPFPVPLYLDCEGPTCKIISPLSDAQLNSLDDQDPDVPGLNLDVRVATDASGTGQPIELVINGDLENARRELAPVEPGSYVATFPKVPFADGSVRLSATCRDKAGVIARSQVSLNVDTSGCTLNVTSPQPNNPFVAAAHGESLSVPVQVALGSDCAKLRFAESADAECTALQTAAFQDISLGQSSVSQSVTLETEGDRFLCVGALDARGNPTSVALPVQFKNRGPSLSFEDPAGSLSIHRAGSESRAADGDPGTRACEHPARVRCEGTGRTVSLVRIPDEVTLAQALCFEGFANFASVPFPSQNDGGTYQVVARSREENGLVGESAPLEVSADCDPPALSFPDYECRVSALSPADDEDPSTPGIQRSVRVFNGPNRKPPVELSVRHVGTDQTTRVTSDLHDGPYTLFSSVTFPEGVVELDACAVDPAGNLGCAGACELMVGDVPRPSFLAPAMNGQLYALDLRQSGVTYRSGAQTAHDCDPATPGLQIEIRASVQNAAAGRPARIALYDAGLRLIDEVATWVDAQGEVSACLQTEDGYGLKLRVEVDAEEPGLYGAFERSVHVLSSAPSAALVSEALNAACRTPNVLQFVAPVTAEGPTELAFELRCAASPIVEESDWNAASPVPGAPRAFDIAAEGTIMQWQLPSAAPGSLRHCSVRGYDHAGAYTPLASSHAFESPALDLASTLLPPEWTAPAGTSADYSVTALGDVNGDGFDDILVSGGPKRALGEAALYLGSSSGLKSEPDVRFVSRDAYEFGQRAVALGNFDNDPQGLMDFAIAAPLSGRIFVVFGRELFPDTEIALDAGGCSADLCIAGALNEELGRSLTSTFFNFDDTPDLVAADRRGALVVLGSSLFEALPRLGASGTGHCLDTGDPALADACGTGVSTPISGFRLRASAAIDHVVSPRPDALYLAHNGGQAEATLWYAPRASYPQASSLISLSSQHLVSAFKPASARPQSQLVATGDLNGDGREDLAWSAPATQSITLLSGGNDALPSGSNDAPLSAWLELHNDLATPENDAFGRLLGLGQHAALGLLSDFSGTGRAELLVSALEALAERGSVEVFANLTLDPLRSQRSLSLSDATLPPNQDLGGYRREGQWVGDVDGDGHLDLAILEPDYDQGRGRLILVGTCGP